MSRNAFPATLPIHFLHQNNESAPRLEERSCLARLAFCALGLSCIGCLFVTATTLGSLYTLNFASSSSSASPPAPSPWATAASTASTASVIVNTQIGRRKKKPAIQRSVIRRLSYVKRAAAPKKGVDIASLRQMFPHWVDENDRISVDAALPELVLALSYLSASEFEDED